MPTPTHAKLHVSVFVHSMMLLPGQMILMLLGLQAVAVVLPLHAQRHLIGWLAGVTQVRSLHNSTQ